MPPRPKGDTPANVRRAARLRAEGVPWAAVAAKLGATLGQVKRWPARHPRLWRRTTLLAEERLLHEATAECVHALRVQLRSADDKTVRDAAQRLIAFRIGWRKSRPAKRAVASAAPPPSTLARRLAAYLETLDDVHLSALVPPP